MIVKNTEKKENNKFEMQVTADAKEFEAAVNAAYLRNKKDIAIPGFRKGKAPRKVIEGMYGAEVFYQDAMDDLADPAFTKAVEESGVKFVGAPSIVSLNITEAKEVEYVFSVELYPEVTLGEYKNLAVEKVVDAVSDEQVAEELESARKRNARKVSVDDRAAANDDTVSIDFKGFLDGVPFEGGEAEDYSLVLGSGSFVPGFEEQVVGMSVGEEKEINVTFPEDYTAELAGKAVVFQVKVNEISVDELPALDDEFAKDNGFDTLDEYKADVKANLEKKAAEEAENKACNDAIRMAIDNMTVEVPEVMINEKVEEIVRSYAANFGLTDRSVDFKQLCAMMGVNEETLNSGIKPNAEMQVKTELLLEAVAAAEAIEVSDEEVEEYAQSIAESVGAPVEQVKAYFGNAYIADEKKKEKARAVIFASVK